PASECGSPPLTELRFSISRSLNMVGNFGGSGRPPKTTFEAVTGAPPVAWYGERVEHIYVKNSKYDVWVGPTPRRLNQIIRGPSYEVTVRELGGPGSQQVVFQTQAHGLQSMPTNLNILHLSGNVFNNNVMVDTLQVGNGVTLYLYAAYSSNHLIDY